MSTTLTSSHGLSPVCVLKKTIIFESASPQKVRQNLVACRLVRAHRVIVIVVVTAILLMAATERQSTINYFQQLNYEINYSTPIIPKSVLDQRSFFCINSSFIRQRAVMMKKLKEEKEEKEQQKKENAIDVQNQNEYDNKPEFKARILLLQISYFEIAIDAASPAEYPLIHYTSFVVL